MNYYKNNNNKVFAYDDEQVRQGYGANLISISEEEATAIFNPPETSEQALASLRRKRNSLLAETDWWASSDLTMTAEQTAYRQALRDITNSYSSLDDVVWPTKP